MDFYSLSDKAIEDELGQRFRDLRLRRNMTQKELAEATTLSLNTIKALEAGKGKLASVIAVLRELQALDELDSFIPQPERKPRQRASGERGRGSSEESSEW